MTEIAWFTVRQAPVLDVPNIESQTECQRVLVRQRRCGESEISCKQLSVKGFRRVLSSDSKSNEECRPGGVFRRSAGRWHILAGATRIWQELLF